MAFSLSILAQAQDSDAIFHGANPAKTSKRKAVIPKRTSKPLLYTVDLKRLWEVVLVFLAFDLRTNLLKIGAGVW